MTRAKKASAKSKDEAKMKKAWNCLAIEAAKAASVVVPGSTACVLPYRGTYDSGPILDVSLPHEVSDRVYNQWIDAIKALGWRDWVIEAKGAAFKPTFALECTERNRPKAREYTRQAVHQVEDRLGDLGVPDSWWPYFLQSCMDFDLEVEDLRELLRGIKARNIWTAMDSRIDRVYARRYGRNSQEFEEMTAEVTSFGEAILAHYGITGVDRRLVAAMPFTLHMIAVGADPMVPIFLEQIWNPPNPIDGVRYNHSDGLALLMQRDREAPFRSSQGTAREGRASEESGSIRTGRDPQYGRRGADPERIATLDRLMVREVEGKDPWTLSDWSGFAPYETTLSQLDIACCFGGRILFDEQPIQAFMIWAIAVRDAIHGKHGATKWFEFYEAAEEVAEFGFNEEIRNGLREQLRSVERGKDAALISLYRGLVEERVSNTRGPILSILNGLDRQNFEHADALFRAVLARRPRGEKSNLSEGFIGATIPDGAPGRRFNFSGHDLRAAAFARSDRREQDFSGSDLQTAIFNNCDLSAADFRGADLRAASFVRSVVRMAAFEGAKRNPGDPRIEGWRVVDGKMTR